MDRLNTYEVTYRSRWTAEVAAVTAEEAERIAWNWTRSSKHKLGGLGNYFRLQDEKIKVDE